jgi:pimeloyl-ACP methyl ester carboxylesterase
MRRADVAPEVALCQAASGTDANQATGGGWTPAMAWVERDGVRLYYSFGGRGDPLVMLHGLGTSSELWRVGGYIEALSDQYSLLTIDARGQGRSDKPTDADAYLMPEHAADVAAVMDVVGVHRAPVFGFSLGAGTAMLLSALHPERVAAVITMGATPTSAEFDDVPPTNHERLLETAALFREQGMSWLVELLEQEGRQQFADLMRQSDAQANALQHQAWATQSRTGARLSSIGVPTLMIWGEQEKPDPGTPLPDSAEVLVIPGADHAGALEAVDVVVPAVRDFLARCASG